MNSCEEMAVNKIDLMKLSWFEESIDKDLETPDRRKSFVRPTNRLIEHGPIWLLRVVRTEPAFLTTPLIMNEVGVR
jgi:hypothetical protein